MKNKSIYKIIDIETITSDNDYGKVLIFMKGQKKAIECISIEFDHEAGTFEIFEVC